MFQIKRNKFKESECKWLQDLYDIAVKNFDFRQYKCSADTFIESIVNGKNNEYVYVLYNDKTGIYKIGKTNDIDARVRSLSTQGGVYLSLILVARLNPYDLDIDSKTMENVLHAYFNKKKIIGEWFSLCVRDLVQIRMLFMGDGDFYFEDYLKEHFEQLRLSKAA